MTMNSKARNYRRPTLKRLHALSGNQCAAPECMRKIIAHDGKTLAGRICHIEAASPEGARWNPNMSDDQRRHFDNLILMCQECHDIIDNPENEAEYPVSLLQKWKKQHESTITYSYLNQHPSLLSKVIDAISETRFFIEEETLPKNLSSINPGEKIKHNNIKRNKSLIDTYKVFYPKINSLYQTLENQGSFKKVNLLRNIESIYIKIKGKYIKDSLNPIQVIRAHADDILEDVQDELLNIVEKGTNNYIDDISYGITIVMVDAFVRCKILEEPPNL